MEVYPSIPKIVQHTPIHAFGKLDGSNCRAEWRPKSGFYKFGTRRRLLDPQEEPLGEAVALFQEKYGVSLSKLFKKQGWQKATVFFEFYGPSSAFGQPQEEEHTVTVFDVQVYKQGLLPPQAFLGLLEGRVEIAPLLYHGNPTQEFITSVRESTLPGMPFEGVVAKGTWRPSQKPVLFKVKSDAWLRALRAHCRGDEQLFERLA